MMRLLCFTLLLSLFQPVWAISCPDAAKQLQAQLGTTINTAELTEALQSLNNTQQLPAKFVTKKQATQAGWKPGSNLWKVLPGKSIGGDRFGNFEKLLPRDQYQEADLDYRGGKRGAKRLVFSRNKRFVTVDHYKTFHEVPPCQ